MMLGTRVYSSTVCVPTLIPWKYHLSLSYSSSSSTSAVTTFAISPWASTTIRKPAQCFHGWSGPRGVANSPLYDACHQHLVRVATDAWLCSFSNSTLSHPTEEIEGLKGIVWLWVCVRVIYHVFVLNCILMSCLKTWRYYGALIQQIPNTCPRRTVQRPSYRSTITYPAHSIYNIASNYQHSQLSTLSPIVTRRRESLSISSFLLPRYALRNGFAAMAYPYYFIIRSTRDRLI